MRQLAARASSRASSLPVPWGSFGDITSTSRARRAPPFHSALPRDAVSLQARHLEHRAESGIGVAGRRCFVALLTRRVRMLAKNQAPVAAGPQVRRPGGASAVWRPLPLSARVSSLSAAASHDSRGRVAAGACCRTVAPLLPEGCRTSVVAATGDGSVVNAAVSGRIEYDAGNRAFSPCAGRSRAMATWPSAASSAITRS